MKEITRNDKQCGFTLLELLITLAIVGTLIAISVPVYQYYVIKTHRAQAAVALMDIASALERYHAIHHTYVGATLADLEANHPVQSEYYRLDINGATENAYGLSAIPLGKQAEDKMCGTLSINQSGEKNISGLGNIKDCWP